MNPELIDFAEEVRRCCVEILGILMDDGTDPYDPNAPDLKLSPQMNEIGVKVALLCQRAADVVQQAQMREEASGEYDLAKLRET